MKRHLGNIVSFVITVALILASTGSAQAESFSGTDSLNVGRAYHTSTLLADGTVLVAGGSGQATRGVMSLTNSEIYNPTTGTWTTTGAMNKPRQNHTATLLPNGKVLVAGTSSHKFTELYDPATGTWTLTGSMNTWHHNHTATLLPNGKVMIAGGAAGAPNVELYDPSTGAWSAASPMIVTNRGGHTATLLPNGKVLVVGGSPTAPASAELYDPATGAWTLTGAMNGARGWHIAELLPDGKVLVAGGSEAPLTALTSAEIYDPATGIWTPTGSLNIDRMTLRSAVMCNGRVLVAGGQSGNISARTTVYSAEVYDPTTGVWTMTDSMAAPRYFHRLTSLADGRVLVSGGLTYLSSAELYGGCAVVSGWTFTDQGFITGGQNGGFRSYNDPSAVAASPWSFESTCKNSLRMSFEDDGNCAGYNPFNQVGTAEAVITVSCPTRMYISWSGMGEQKDPSPSNPVPFELMDLFVDNTFIGRAHSPGGDLGCEAPMAPVVSAPAPPQYVDLQPGVHTLRIETETADEKFHIDAFYQFDLSFQSLAEVAADRVDAGGFHSLVAMFDGSVWAWGWNGYGGLGDGTTIQRLTPVQVINFSNAVAVAGGDYHSLALRNDGTVWAWGYNADGQLGDGTTFHRTSPVQVTGLAGVKAIAAGKYTSYALLPNGSVYAWGQNTFGQVGDGTSIARLTPVPVIGLTNAISIAGGAQHGLAVRNNGTIWAWGGNAYGQLGNGTTTASLTPVQTTNFYGAVSVQAGHFFTLALRSDGTVWGWGSDNLGQLGNGTTATSFILPVQTVGLSNVVRIGTGYYHSLAVKNDGTLWAWGSNGSGQLGDGTTIVNSSPVNVVGISDGLMVSGGYAHSMTVKSDFSLRTWGRNLNGQVGDGTTVNKPLPVNIGVGL